MLRLFELVAVWFEGPNASIVENSLLFEIDNSVNEGEEADLIMNATKEYIDTLNLEDTVNISWSHFAKEVPIEILGKYGVRHYAEQRPVSTSTIFDYTGKLINEVEILEQFEKWVRDRYSPEYAEQILEEYGISS
jgi:hypothetical protein